MICIWYTVCVRICTYLCTIKIRIQFVCKYHIICITMTCMKMNATSQCIPLDSLAVMLAIDEQNKSNYINSSPRTWWLPHEFIIIYIHFRTNLCLISLDSLDLVAGDSRAKISKQIIHFLSITLLRESVFAHFCCCCCCWKK